MKNIKQTLKAIQANVATLRHLTTTYSDSEHFITPEAAKQIPTPILIGLGTLDNLAISLEDQVDQLLQL